jgi:hypothetical protein
MSPVSLRGPALALLLFSIVSLGGCSLLAPVGSGDASRSGGSHVHCLDSPGRNTRAEVTRPMLFFMCVQGP